MNIEDTIDKKAKQLTKNAGQIRDETIRDKVMAEIRKLERRIDKKFLPSYVTDKRSVYDNYYQFIGADELRTKKTVENMGEYFNAEGEFNEEMALALFEESARRRAKKQGADLVYAVNPKVDYWESSVNDDNVIFTVRAQLEFYRKKIKE